MKFQLIHESNGRMRIHILPGLSLAQADMLQYWLEKLPGTKRAIVHERTGNAIIEYRPPQTRNQLIAELSRFSFSDLKPNEIASIHSARALNREYEEKLVMRVLGKVFRRLFFPPALRACWSTLHGLPYLWRALQCLLHGRLQVELLDGISIGLSLFRKDFTTAGSVRFLLSLGSLLEEWTHKKSVSDLARSMSLNVDRVWRIQNDQEVLVPMTDIEPGDVILIRVGGMIPIDGEILNGDVMVNQASLTGESVPVSKHPGTRVYAGTIVEEGECTIRVMQETGNSRYDKIVEMIEASERLKSTAEQTASNLADKLVPYTLAGSALTYLLTRNPTRALSILMVDFSCALKLAMPLSVLSAIRELSSAHITVKGGKFLEATAKADTIVFDKTGTLTHACPTLANIVTFGDHDPDEMLRIAACLEEHFPHSMANAVVRAANQKGLLHDEMHSKVEYIVAHGIVSSIDTQKVLIGSYHFIFEDEQCTIPAQEKAKFDSIPPQYSQLYMAIGGELAAVLCIHDPLRAEASSVLRTLKSLGIKRTVMLTGDSYRTAKAIAQEVGVDDFQAEVLPEDKAEFVERERKLGHTVIMLGDGINDAPALSAADIGIAISDGAAIAREIADITISADSLEELIKLRKVATALMERIQKNYRFVIGFNGSLITLGAIGILPPSTAAMLHNLSTLGVSLRSMTNVLPQS
ncbi:MAG: heavy metal translocating P-type ATPase [Proteobacteria bacterium]|nr:heavy metal translocating P-type ATPase [Pseudomonadota bacterium]